MKIYEAHASWKEEILPEVIRQYGADDEAAISESWNDYTDALCRDGELSDLQYQYCPSWDDVTFQDDEDEAEHLLDSMGVVLSLQRVSSRPDGVAHWGEAAQHFEFTLSRGSAGYFGHFSQGPAFKVDPTLADVFHSLLMDASGADQTFEDWADDYGYDTDSRSAERTYNACRGVHEALNRMFKVEELADLQTAFEDL